MLAPALTTCVNAGLTEPELLASPPQLATIAWVPTASVEVAHVAFAALTLTLLQPAMAFPLSVKPTVPVGEAPVIVAVNVTLAPNVDGVSELVTAVVVGLRPAIANRNRCDEPSVTYTAPLATIGLCQCLPPSCSTARCH